MGLIKWIKNWVYGGAIKETIGSLVGKTDGHGGKVELRVHLMAPDDGTRDCVGLEIVYTNLANYKTAAIMLPVDKAEELRGLIQQTAERA